MIAPPLSIVTINTGKGDGPYRRRIELLSDGLAALAPDIVLLQEAFAAPEIQAHTAHTLADRLNLSVAFAPARRKARDIEGVSVLSDSGLAILSREPLAATTTIDLPADPADGERIALLATLSVNGHSCLIANVHLSHLRGHDALRRTQIVALLAHPWFDRAHDIRLIGGDLNTPHDQLSELFGDTPAWSWRDAWIAASGPEARATVPVNAPPEDGRCIDFILSIARGSGAHPQFQNARVVLGRSDDDGVYPSDHRGVLVEMLIDDSTGVRL